MSGCAAPAKAGKAGLRCTAIELIPMCEGYGEVNGEAVKVLTVRGTPHPPVGLGASPARAKAEPSLGADPHMVECGNRRGVAPLSELGDGVREAPEERHSMGTPSQGGDAGGQAGESEEDDSGARRGHGTWIGDWVCAFVALV